MGVLIRKRSTNGQRRLWIRKNLEKALWKQQLENVPRGGWFPFIW